MAPGHPSGGPRSPILLCLLPGLENLRSLVGTTQRPDNTSLQGGREDRWAGSPTHGTAAWRLLLESVPSTPHSRGAAADTAPTQASGKLRVTLRIAVLTDGGD